MESDTLASYFLADGDRRRSATSPTVSIVMVSKDPEDVLEAQIAELRSHFGQTDAEYVVAWAEAGHTTGELRRRLPHIRFISAPQDTSLADLRVQGIKAAAGDIVLLLQRDKSLHVTLPDFPKSDRKENGTERSGSSKRAVTLGHGRDRARAASG